MPYQYGQYQRIEVGFGLDNFSRPVAYTGPDAWVRQIVQLCIFDPGTIPSNPTIGIGLKRFDFLLEEDRRRIASEINRQVPIFYPDIPFASCVMQLPQDDEPQDILYLLITFSGVGSQGSVELETVAVAMKKGYNYIDFAIAM